MSENVPFFADELYALLDDLCDGSLTEDGAARLDKHLRDDPAARREYLSYLGVHAGLGLIQGRPSAAIPDDQPSATDEQPCLIPPIVLNASPTIHSGLAGSLFSPGGFLFSYTMSAVILGIGLLVGLAWRNARDPRIAVDPARQPRGVVPAPAEMPIVGRVTGMDDCRWADPQVEVYRGDYVRLGHEYGLASGYLEITYQSGAKVILQGPVEYTVESRAGGFSAIGKLTAQIDMSGAGLMGPDSGVKGERTANPTLARSGSEPTASLAPRPFGDGRGEGRGERGERDSHYPLSTTHYPLFYVRTPTAVVTDLGTEFGVSVDRSGATRSHVFRGRVELRPFNSKPSGSAVLPPPPIVLGAGQSARVEPGAGNILGMVREHGEHKSYIRQMPLSGSRPSTLDSRLSTLNSPRYRLIDLGTLGGPESRAIGINAAGQVAGYSTTAGGERHAFFYRDGVMTDLHPSGRSSISMASAVNSRGQVAGDYLLDDDKTCRAFLYCDGKTTTLGTLHGGDSFVRGMNDRGQVVGFCTDRKTGRSRAFLWSDGEITDLGALGTDSYAHDVNADGLVVGYCATAGKTTNRAFLYRPGVGMKDLGTLGGRVSVAMRINNLGQIVGSSATAEAGDGVRMGFRAFLYDPGGADSPTRSGKMIDLGSLGGYASTAYGINGKGQIVGDAVDAHHVIHAFLRQANGTMIDLNAAVDPALGWTISNARAINDAGQIAGFGTDGDGNIRAFLLTPLVVQASRLHGAAETPAPPTPDPQRKEGAPMK